MYACQYFWLHYILDSGIASLGHVAPTGVLSGHLGVVFCFPSKSAPCCKPSSVAVSQEEQQGLVASWMVA